MAPAGQLPSPMEAATHVQYPDRGRTKETKGTKRCQVKRKRAAPSREKDLASKRGTGKTKGTAFVSHLSGSQQCCASASPVSTQSKQTKPTKATLFLHSIWALFLPSCVRTGESRQAEEGSKRDQRRKKAKADQASAQPDNQTKQQPKGGKEQAAPITLG